MSCLGTLAWPGVRLARRERKLCRGEHVSHVRLESGMSVLAGRGTDKLTLDHRGPYSKFMIMEAPRKLFKLVVWMALCAKLGLSNCEDRKDSLKPNKKP